MPPNTLFALKQCTVEKIDQPDACDEQEYLIKHMRCQGFVKAAVQLALQH